MANRPYLQGLYHYGNKDLSWLADNIKVVLCTSGYTPNTAAGGDEFLNVIAGGNQVAISGNLASKTNVGGTFDAADLTLSSVSGSTVTQFAIYNDTGTSSTSELEFLYDTATNMPVVPNGGNITIQWAGSPNFIATLASNLSDADKRLIDRFGWRNVLKWIRDMGIPADKRCPGGIWVPTPTLTQA